MPVKVAISGLTRNAKCYLGIFNCAIKEFEYVRTFDHGAITALAYGPFDNGPILTGWQDGAIRMYGAYALELQAVYERANQPIVQISYDPLNYIYACTSKEIFGFEAMPGIDSYEYLYIDIPR